MSNSLPPNFRTFENEYRELYEAFMSVTRYLDGGRMSRQEKHRINAALDKAAKRFNASALTETTKGTKTV